MPLVVTRHKFMVFKSSICEDYYFVKHICLTPEATLSKHNAQAANSQRDADGCFIDSLRTHDHITDALTNLHWLWVLERIRYKLSWCAKFFMALHHVTFVC